MAVANPTFVDACLLGDRRVAPVGPRSVDRLRIRDDEMLTVRERVQAARLFLLRCRLAAAVKCEHERSGGGGRDIQKVSARAALVRDGDRFRGPPRGFCPAAGALHIG